ncbi:hypothetical protein IIC38_07020 [candidate division KSB1 bacterium]|nr:hypothetical protein [candidate division KSB1 bacterium]
MISCLTSVKNLFRELDEQEIHYCIWKGNTHLQQAAQGHSDLDLLVDHRKYERFKGILEKHDCKLMLSPPAKKIPDVEDYLGCDEKTGKCFHLHVYYKIILGDNPFNTYRLPLEQNFLDSSKSENGFKVASPELAVLARVVITLLRYRNRDVIKDILAILTPGIPPKTVQTFHDLTKQTTIERISSTLKSDVKFISPEIVIRFLEVVTKTPHSGYKIYQIRRALRKQLAAYRTYNRWQSALRSVNIGNSSPEKKKLASRGLVVALIGADGAGKSSMLTNLSKWLSWKLKVQLCYMGLGKRLSFGSRMTQSCARFFSRLNNVSVAVVGNKKWLSNKLKTIYNFTYDLHYVSVAWTRYFRYLASRKEAERGSIVLCDRYPLSGIHQVMMNSTRAPMDGPQIKWKYQDGKMNWMTSHLSKLELKLYNKIYPPDCVLLLQVAPNVALKRKPDHTPQEIEPKIQAIENMSRNGLKIIDIDANQPFDQALLYAKEELWKIM